MQVQYNNIINNMPKTFYQQQKNHFISILLEYCIFKQTKIAYQMPIYDWIDFINYV